MFDCDGWKIYKTDIFIKQNLRDTFTCKMPLRGEKLLEIIKSWSLFGSIQCDIEVLENLQEAFPKFQTIFNNFNVGRDNIGAFMKECAQKEGLFTQPKRLLISS